MIGRIQKAVVLDGWLQPLDADVYNRVEQPVRVLCRFERRVVLAGNGPTVPLPYPFVPYCTIP